MFNDKSDDTTEDGSHPADHHGEGFKSQRMPENAAPYNYLMIETGRELLLACNEATPKPDTPLGRYRERQNQPSINPVAVRERLQGLLLDGLLVAHMRLPSGVIVRVSSEAFGDDSEDSFAKMERGQPITALVSANDLLDASLDLQELHREQTGTVFFYEDQFRAAQANDPITEIDGHAVPTATAVTVPVPPAPVDDRAIPSETGLMGLAIPDAGAASLRKPRGRTRDYPDLPKAINDVFLSRTERYSGLKDFHTEMAPKLGKNPPNDKTVERRAAEHARWNELKPLPKRSKMQK